MSQIKKLTARLLSRPKDLSWDELTSLLRQVGYEEEKGGKTGGSRRRFMHPRAAPILLHKPHPGNTVKRYALIQMIETLRQEGLL